MEGQQREASFDRVKLEDGDIDMADGAHSHPITLSEALPPHLLLLVLESGTFVFLFIHRQQVCLSTFRHSDHKLGNLGFHMAVDPTSRYLAVADIENKVVVYQLESWENMNRQYHRSRTITPIMTHSPRTVPGLVHKMEFLHPRPQDHDYHVILLLIVISKKGSNMVIYDWEAGENFSQVLAEEKQGHRLPAEHRMPLFLVPLTVLSSFLVVSEHSIGFCKDPLQGPPMFDLVNPGAHPPSPYHHGLGAPLWTAWDRPVRRRHYYQEHDHIYLAREDGVIAYWEMDKNDVTGAVMNVGTCNCSISSAFATMEETQSDLAIIAGDSGPGMICQVGTSALLRVAREIR